MISQQQTQRQQLKILPQQIQLLNLYFLNTLELEQRIKTELEENVILEQKEESEFDELEGRTAKDVQDYQDYEEFKYF
jgi:RNA polymerase sigma-54 factor